MSANLTSIAWSPVVNIFVLIVDDVATNPDLYISADGFNWTGIISMLGGSLKRIVWIPFLNRFFVAP